MRTPNPESFRGEASAKTEGTREKAFARGTRRWTQMKEALSVSALICVICGQVRTPMDPKATQLRIDALDAVKNADGRRQNVQKYG
jgi:hypothetical protein